MECMGSGNFGDSNLSFVQRLSSFQGGKHGLGAVVRESIELSEYLCESARALPVENL